MYLIVGMGPDQGADEPYEDASDDTVEAWNSDNAVRGPLGGPEGADSGYGYTTGADQWYDPATGTSTGVNSDGDIGYGSG